MTVEVLRSARQVAEARSEMERRGIDCASSLASRLLRRAGILKGVDVGDRKKSWDVLKTIAFIERNVPRDAPVLDIGAYQSEILPALHRLGYTNLVGADLNPRIGEMPHADAIRYLCGDFMNLPCAAASFDCVTAISVIEHGFDPDRLLGELNRLLKPGGRFIASVDYWPEKIETAGIREYGMDWTIFSEEELRSFIAGAEGYGLAPVGEMTFGAGERAVAWNGKRYTFAWLALRKIRQDPG